MVSWVATLNFHLLKEIVEVANNFMEYVARGYPFWTGMEYMDSSLVVLLVD